MRRNDYGARWDSACMITLLVVALGGCGGGDGSGGTNHGNGGNTAASQAIPVYVLSGALAPKNTLYSPIRIAAGAGDRLFVSDSKSDSVFIIKNLLVDGELKGLARPLGVAVDAAGNIYVGNDGRDNVEVYDTSGNMLREYGTGTIQMPNSLALDREGNLYVADSLANNIKVYATDGHLLRTIGDGVLSFPVAVTVAYRGGAGEIYVADQMNSKIQVFSLSGTLQRAYGTRLTKGDANWQGKFVQLQSLAVDATGHLHVLDSALSLVQVLNATSGAYLDSYSSRGKAEGQLFVPLDITITENNQVMVTNNGNHRIDMLRDLN